MGPIDRSLAAFFRTDVPSSQHRDIQRICELLARFSMYTQQLEQEGETTHDNHPQTAEAETLGTLQERVSDTRATHRRTRRPVPKTVNEKAAKKKPTTF